MRRDASMVSDLHLEQYVLGELPATERKRVRDALDADGTLRARLEAIERSTAEILSAYPPERIVPLIRQKSPGEQRPRRTLPSWTFILPAAAALLILFSALGVREGLFPQLSARGGAEETRVKSGLPHLSIFRKTSAGAEELADGSTVHPADVLQISYTAGDARYGAIFSIDGRGVVTFHLPENYDGRALVSPGLDGQGQSVLPFAYELDDAPGFERFFLVYSRSTFDVQKVAEAARALSSNPQAASRDRLQLAPGLSSSSLILKKQG